MNRLIPMIGAQWMALRKRRGLFWLSMALTVGGVVIMNGVVALYHATNPAQYGPAGGLDGFTHAYTLFGITGALAAILIGATAGAQDVESGVFRSLVSTGQSRAKLALVRIPGGLLMLLPMLLGAYAVEVAASFMFAGGTPTPDATTILVGLGWVTAIGVLDFTVALGIAALTRTRGVAIGLLLAWEVAGSRVIERFTAFGNWRGLISTVATDRLLPHASDTIQLTRVDSISLPLAMALAVVAAWIVAGTAVGVWRTVTQDA
ncbi:MAG: hypothetical protein JOY80_12745 [Candidatus Dormibacteraeota bacterium]|nr:hypothetical protein [Candidatus Dormibacteraeota bacterium]